MHPLPKASRKRIEILKSAAAVFRRRGYHGAKIEDIAARLGMTKGNLYYYFKDKEEILFVCLDYSVDILLDRLREVERSDVSPVDKLRALIKAFVHVVIDELQGTGITLDLLDLSPPLLRRIISKRDRFERGMRAIVRAGMDQGVICRANPKLVTFAILGAVNWVPRWFDPSGAANSGEIGEAFADHLLLGLVVSAPRRRSDAPAIVRLRSSHSVAKTRGVAKTRRL